MPKSLMIMFLHAIIISSCYQWQFKHDKIIKKQTQLYNLEGYWIIINSRVQKYYTSYKLKGPKAQSCSHPSVVLCILQFAALYFCTLEFVVIQYPYKIAVDHESAFNNLIVMFLDCHVYLVFHYCLL